MCGMAKVRRFNVTLRPAQWRFLQQEARRLKISASALLRRILDQMRAS